MLILLFLLHDVLTTLYRKNYSFYLHPGLFLQNLEPSEETLPDRVAEALHSLSHAYHALSDLTFNFRGPEPRRPSVLTSLSPHIPQVPMLSSFVGAPQLVPTQSATVRLQV